MTVMKATSGRGILKRAKEVLSIEAEAIQGIISQIDENFVRAVRMLSECRGRVIVTGMGKAGIVGKKIAATLSSTGTPAFSMNPAEAFHGDLGMIVREDIVLAISNSGKTEELVKIIPLIKKIGASFILLTGDINAPLAKSADVVLSARVKQEACPLGLVPTASTTAALAMGDAIAMVLLDEKGFQKGDYAFFHPGGELGKKARK